MSFDKLAESLLKVAKVLQAEEDGPEFPGDYLVTMTYDVVTEESAAEGDFEESGFEFQDESFESLEDAVKTYENEHNWISWSSSSPRAGDWVLSEGDKNFRTGDETSYSLFLKRKDKKPLSKEEIQYITKMLRIR